MVRQSKCWMGILILMASIAASAAVDVNAVDFDLQGFVDKAIQMKLDPIVVPPGRYRVTPRHQQHLVLRDLQDVRIIANGVEMICTETTRALTIENCQNLTVKGLTIDYDPLPYTQGRIVKLSENNTVHDIELFDGYARGDQVQDFKYEIFKADTRTLRFGSYFEFRAVDKQAAAMMYGLLETPFNTVTAWALPYTPWQVPEVWPRPGLTIISSLRITNCVTWPDGKSGSRLPVD